jgi:hypothetical protein
MTASAEIYVYLLNEGTDCWRPVSAEYLGEDLYRISSANENPDDESWEFAEGEVVRCRLRKLSGGECLVAYASASTSST